MSARRSYRRKRSKKPLIILIVIVVIVAAAGFGAYRVLFAPTGARADLNEYYEVGGKNACYVVADHKRAKKSGLLIDGEAYIHIDTVQSMISSRYYWDASEQLLIYTLPETLVSVPADSKTYSVGKKEETAKQPVVITKGENAYLSLSFIRSYTPIRAEVYEEPDRIVVDTLFGEVETTTVKKNTQLRTHGGNKSEIVADLEKGDQVTVIEAFENWSEVASEEGELGYIKNSALGDTESVNYQAPEVAAADEDYTHITQDDVICLAWHQVTNLTANGSLDQRLAAAAGINVISPTWFYLADNEGNITSLCSSDYVARAHAKGLRVWGLISNFETDVDTTAILNHSSLRQKVVNNVVAEAIRYDLDGINVDFEALSGDVGYSFIQFVRELSVKCRTNGLVLSVDNYPIAAHTGIYYAAEQAVFADYVILMAYDEHFAGSDPGSVASISYVKTSVSDMLEVVPKKQLILGVPMYTRLWATKTGSSGEENVSSKTLGLGTTQEYLSQHQLTPEWNDEYGQSYIEFTANEKLYQLWVEDAESISLKLDVMEDEELAGVAFWKLGYDTASIWSTITPYLK